MQSTQSVVSMRAESKDPLEDILRSGAQRMLQQAVESEVEAYIASYADERDSRGHRLVVRNGWHPKRSIQTGIGDIEVKRPKVNDKRLDAEGQRLRFSSKILPAYLRRTKNIEELIPWLYLRGISTGDFSQALESLLGKDAPGLSAATVTRLKSCWQKEYRDWSSRSLEDKYYPYIWVDGIYTRVRLGEDKKVCMLVIIGADETGKKELLAIEAGERESKISWSQVLLDLKRRGLTRPPKIAVADGALGFWAALSEIFPDTAQQVCWVHKMANVLDKLPDSKQAQAKAAIHNMYEAATRKEAEAALDIFIESIGDRYDRAVKSLVQNRDRLFSYYDFPAAHWKHLRTSNPIESTFATIRLRTKRTKGSGSPAAALTMVFKLARCAEKKWQRLRKSELIRDVISDEFKFVDGEKQRVA